MPMPTSKCGDILGKNLPLDFSSALGGLTNTKVPHGYCLNAAEIPKRLSHAVCPSLPIIKPLYIMTQYGAAHTHHLPSAPAPKIEALVPSMTTRFDLSMIPLDCGRCGTEVKCAKGLNFLISLEAALNSGAQSVHQRRACCPSSTPSN